MAKSYFLQLPINNGSLQNIYDNARTCINPSIQWIAEHPTTTLCVTALGLGVASWYHKRRWTNLPPGPLGLPIFGNYFEISEDMHLDCMRFGEEYGDVFSFQIGPKTMVILNSLTAIKEAFVSRGDAFSDRSGNTPFHMELQCGTFISPFCEKWKEDKKFAAAAFRGARAKHQVDEKILSEVFAVLDELKQSEGEATNFTHLFMLAGANVISDVLFNQRYDHSDPALQELVDIITVWYESVNESYGFSVFLPVWMSKLVIRRMIQRITKNTRTIEQYIIDKVKEHQETFDPDEIRDFIDAYISDRDIEKMGMKCLADTTMSFLPDAVDTVAALLNWIILYMVVYPNIQKKIQEQLDQVVCSNRVITMADRAKLTWIDATVIETFRFSSVINFTAEHIGVKDTTFRDWNISRNVHLLGNLYAVHMDPNIHPNPEVFRPERFLNDDCTEIVRSDTVIPFGMGRRMCLGEQHIRMQLFLFMSNLLNNYTFELPENHLQPNLSPVRGIIQHPHPFQVIPRPRY